MGGEVVEVARATSALGELVLRERHEDGRTPVLELRANGLFVMDTGETTSERAMASRTLARCRHPERVLVGGLGLGFTVQEALADDRVREVTVAEIEPALEQWMRDGTIPHGPALVADPRVKLRLGDLGDVVRRAGAASYDLVLLDVDNGPDHLVHAGNAALYQPPFLTELRRILAPGGLLVIWSATRSNALASAMRAVFGSESTESLDVDLQGREERYWLHLAPVPSAHG